MKKKLKVLITIGAIIFTGMGCTSIPTSKNASEPINVDESKFEVISVEKIVIREGTDRDRIAVVKHKETGKSFVIYKGYESVAMQPLD